MAAAYKDKTEYTMRILTAGYSIVDLCLTIEG